MFRGSILISIFIYCLGITAQEQFSFRQLTVKEGLSQNSVVSIAQDSLGYLWMATQDGLNRYDGRSIKQYPFQFTDITRPNFSRLGKIYVDRVGNIFIIPFDHNIYRYDRLQDNFLRVGTLTNAATIWQDASMNYWVGSYDGEVFKLDEDFSIAPSHGNIRLSGQIKKGGLEKHGNQYILSEKSLIKLNNATLAIEEIPLETLTTRKMESNLSTAAFDNDGILWLGYHGDGLFYYDENTSSIRRLHNTEFEGYLPSDLTVLHLFFDRAKRMWLTTYGDGMYLLDFTSKKIMHFSEQKENPRALHYNDILCAFQDGSGTLWFGTDGAGVSFYDADLEKFNSFTNFQTPANINIDVVRALTVDGNNDIWIGTSGKGLTKYERDTNSWITFTTRNSELSSNRIMSLQFDVDGNLWVGTQGGGLMLLDQDNIFKIYNPESKIPLPAKTIWDILEDNGNSIWLGTRDNGLIRFDKENGVQTQHKEFTVSDSVVVRNNIRVIIKDQKGFLWLGTDDRGLIKFNPKTLQSSILTTQNSPLVNNGIKSLYLDSQEVLWIGTSGGGLDAYEIKTGKFHNYSTEDGLPNNVVYGILPDASGNLWLSSNKGITKFRPPGSFNAQPEIVNYDNYDGLATEFNTGAYYKHDDGRLYFGGLEGFYWFDPQTISENQYLPKTALTYFKVLDKSKSVYSDTVLNYNENTIDFTFSSLQFSEPGKNQYRYRLLPYEEDWVASGNKNFVRYTHLPPDDYQFQVVSSNYDGKWNDHAEKFNFSIKAPWYFNTWSKSLYALLLLLTVLIIYGYLKWRWKMKLDLQLKEEEALRFKKLNDYKSKIYTDIAHEFRTPLTLISGPIESKLSQPDISEEEVDKFTMIERNASRLTNLVDQLLQLARLEEGRFQLNPKWGNLGLFLKSLAAAFEFEAEQKEVTYTYTVQEIPNALYDEDALDKIVVNLISNALKHGRSKGNCHFDAHFNNGFLSLIIKNETEGDQVDTEQLFERFYQKDKSTKGAGIGLSLVKELVKLQHGEITVNQEDNTIAFQLSLPLKVRQPEKDEEKSIPKELISKSEKGEEKPILLVVEDHADVLEFIAAEFQVNYKIITAKNGTSGIKKAIAQVPDIIISDVKMPGTTGIALCNTLKTDARTSHIPIILLTASSDKQNELKGLKAGADDYVTKPFKMKLLEKRVENLVKSRQLLRERYSQENFLKPKDIALTPADELFFKKIEEVMDEHLANPDFNAEKFSRHMTMSRMQLHRKLMAYTGLTTSAFIRSQRLKQAVQILKTSDATINEVAYTVGFNTPSYFIKCFKETYKKTPAEYLQSYRK